MFLNFQAEQNRKYRVGKKLPKVLVTQYPNSRSVFVERTFTEGKYVIIPTILEQAAESPLMLRVFTTEGSPIK